MEPSLIERISEVTEFNDISEFIGDKDIDEAMDLIIRLVSKPEISSLKAPALIVKLQSLSAKFALMARYYTTFEKGGNSSKKKNVYYTMSDSLDKLCDSIKYMARFGA